MCKVKGGAQAVSSYTSFKPQSLTTQNNVKSWDGDILVTFSSVNLKTLTECGQQKAYPDGIGESFFLEKKIIVTEWEYSTKNYTPVPKYKKQIFVDCSDADGDELYQASGVFINNEKDNALRDAKLISELVFAVRQLKDYLYSLNLQGYKKGTVHLYICGIHPVECLLFGFQKVLGFSVEKEDLYKDFVNKVFDNALLMRTQSWMKNQGWNVKLEYCSVQQIYLEEVKVLTEYGKRMKSYREMCALRDVLKKPTETIEKHYKESDSLRYEPHTTNYKKAVADWKSKGGITRIGNGGYEYGGVDYVNMEYPAIEHVGRIRTYQQMCWLINRADSEERKKLIEAQEMEALKKRRDEIKKQADDEEQKLRRDEKKFKEGRGAEIQNKLKELETRKEVAGDPTTFWNERYDQDYAPEGGYETPEYAAQKAQDRELIEFEGELLNEDQLKAKIAEVNNDHYKRKKEIEKLREAAEKLQDNIDDLFWDRILTGIQLTLAVGCMIAAPFASPFVAVAVLGVGAAVVDIGLEVTKWVVVDDTWDEHLKEHLTTICLDVAFAAFGPLFKKVVGKIAANMVGKEIAATEKGLEETRKTYLAAEKAATTAEVDAAFAKLETSTVKTAADTEAAAARAEATAARSEAKAAQIDAKEAQKGAEQWESKFNLATTGEEKAQILTRLEAAETEAQNKLVTALEKEGEALKKEAEAARREISAASQRPSAKLEVDAFISRTKANAAKTEVIEGEQRLETLRKQQQWLNDFSKPLQNANHTANVAVDAGKNSVFTSLSKVMGYDTIADLDKALKLVETGYAHTSAKIRLSRTGFLLVNTGLNIKKQHFLITSGIAYFRDDWVKVDYTAGVDKTVLKSAN